VILGISVASIGFFIFWRLVFTSVGWDDENWEYFSYLGLPPLLMAVFGTSFMYARLRSFKESDESFWVALILYAAFGIYLLWFVYTQTAGFGAT